MRISTRCRACGASADKAGKPRGCCVRSRNSADWRRGRSLRPMPPKRAEFATYWKRGHIARESNAHLEQCWFARARIRSVVNPSSLKAPLVGADGGGFEPPLPFGKHAFQACAIDRSATHPDASCPASAGAQYNGNSAAAQARCRLRSGGIPGGILRAIGQDEDVSDEQIVINTSPSRQETIVRLKACAAVSRDPLSKP